MKKRNYLTACLLVLIGLLSGCEKFLEEKSDKRLTVPTTLKDFQALLSQSGFLNVDFVAAGEVSAGEFYVTDEDMNTLNYESDKRLYTWQPDYVTRTLSSAGDEWYNSYKAIFICNSVLEGLLTNNLTGPEADNIKGQALVFRAARYLDAVQIWAPAYNRLTATTDLGMVLRVDPDMNIPSVRSSVQETYDLIIKDLTKAVDLLPLTQPGVTLPTKGIAHGVLARANLFMGNYENARAHAENALAQYSTLIDFNTLDSTANFPIPAVKESSAEVVFWNSMFWAEPLSYDIAKITTDLYGLYAVADLRKGIYFQKNDDGSYTFKGYHIGYQGSLGGISTSELILTAAECQARTGQLAEAAEMLNRLLVNRMKSEEFTPVSFSNQATALQTILQERRKELVYRGLRWPDIKRLNRDGANITLTRVVNGETFTLAPNDPRFAIAIPEDVIEISGIQQNPR